MARTPPNPTRWRFAQAASLTCATIAGLVLIQFTAASRQALVAPTPPEMAAAPPPARMAARGKPDPRDGKRSSRGAAAAASAWPTSAPTTRAVPPRPRVEEVDESDVLLASDKIPAKVASTVPAVARAPAAEGLELLHDIRSPSAPAVFPVPAAAPAAEMAPTIAATGEPKPVKRPVRVLRLQVTAYCPCPKCCGSKAEGVTASGLPITYNGGAFVAADTGLLPFGTRLRVPGYDAGRPVEVIDRGGAIKGRCIDVFFPTHEQAREWGRRWVNVTVVE